MAKVGKRYFKLGVHAASFTDTYSGLVISGKQIVSIDKAKLEKNKKIKDALTSGHIIELKADELSDKTIVDLPIPEIDRNKKKKMDQTFVKNMQALLSEKTTEEEETDDEDELVDETDEEKEQDKEIGPKTGLPIAKLIKRIKKSEKIDDLQKKNLHKLSIEALEELYAKTKEVE